jgi:hypothetical protein
MFDRFLRLAVLIPLLAALAPSGPAQSQPAVLVHIDFDTWNQGFPGSRMAECWNSPVVQQWRQTTLQEMLGMAQAQSGIDMQSLRSHLIGEAALAFSLPPNAGSGMAVMPSVSIAFKQPGQIDSLMALIQSRLSPEQNQQLQALTIRQGDVVAFGTDGTLSSQLIAGLTAGDIGLPMAPGSFVTGKIDAASLIRQGMAQSPPDALAAFEDLGLRNISAIDFHSGFEGRGLTSSIDMQFDGPRTGLMSLIGSDTTHGALSLTPANTQQVVSVSTLPLTEIWTWVSSMVVKHGGPSAAQDLQEGEATFQQRIGMSLRDQVLPAFGDEQALVIGGVMGMSVNAALISEVTDTAAVQQFLQSAVQAINQDMSAQGMSLTSMPITSGDVTYQMIAMPGMPFQICYGIIGDRLVTATSQLQMNAIAQAAASGQNITTTPGYQQVASQMPAQSALFSYQDNANTVQSLSQSLLPMMSMAAGEMPPEVFTLMSQLPSLAPHMGVQTSTLSASPTRLSVNSHLTSGAEMIVSAMAIVTGLQVAMEQQMQQLQIDSAPTTGEPTQTAPQKTQ